MLVTRTMGTIKEHTLTTYDTYRKGTKEEEEEDTMPAKRTYKESDEEIRLILEKALTKNPGRSLNNIHYDTHIPVKVLKEQCDQLVEMGILIQNGTGTAMRYYPKDADRRTMNPKADKPLLGHGSGPERKPAYNPSPLSLLDPPDNGIPADLKAFEPITEPIVAPEPTPEPTPDPIPEPTPEPTPEPPVTDDDVDIDALFAQLDSLRAIPRGGPFDTQLDAMVSEAEERIRSSLRACPHCARHAKLVTSAEGKHSILCDCGAMFAYAKDPTSLKCTIKAYNRRSP